MFDHRRPNCPHCSYHKSRRIQSRVISHIEHTYSSHSFVGMEIAGRPKRKGDEVPHCSAEVNARHSRLTGLPSGNFVSCSIQVVFATQRKWWYASELNLHVEHIDAGHVFWHRFASDCHRVGFSEVNYAEFCNWLLLVSAQMMNTSLRHIDNLGKNHEPNIRQMFRTSMAVYAEKFWEYLLPKINHCDRNHQHHKNLHKKDFFEYLAPSIRIAEMFADATPVDFIDREINKAKQNYLFHYTYHFKVMPKPDMKFLYSDIMENKVYGRLITLPKV